MKKLILIIMMVVICGGFIATWPHEGFTKDSESAEKLAEKVLKKLGGDKAWAKNRYLRFDYVVVENGNEQGTFYHLWDKLTDNYRIEWYDTDDNYVIVMLNLTNMIGTAYKNGEMVDYENTEPYIQKAYSRFASDSFWLTLPYKLLTSNFKGANSKPSDMNNDDHFILSLVIENKGSIPEGEYQLYVNQKTKTIDRCRFNLQNGKSGDYYLKNWEKYGKLKFFNTLETADGKTIIKYDNLQAFNYITPQIFDNIHLHLP